MGSRTVAILLIVVGSLLLLEKRGFLPDMGSLLRGWWPLLLIAGGVVMLVRRR
jgi:hypothetical protein